MSDAVRRARLGDLPLLADIELGADRLFSSLGIVFPPGPTVVEEAAQAGADIYVAGDPPVGFAAVEDRDGHTHLEQIAVHPDHLRQGIGGRLLGRVLAHAAETGSAGVTLITFRDVPWNGPWYARRGFTELPEERFGPEIRTLWLTEIDAGLHDLAPRLVMWSPPMPAE
ncbi:MAG: GNAT family N-acetyltransferase [Actinomadura sp.]